MSKFDITITAKARHGKLWELRKKFGTNKALAEYLEVGDTELGRWINLKHVPTKMTQKRIDHFQKKLIPYGLLFEDLFPLELKDVLDKPKDFEITREINLLLLSDGGGIKLLDSPDKYVELNELDKRVNKAIGTLTPREEKVIRMRFGLGEEDEHTLDEVGEILRYSKERIRQIEMKALRKLRRKPGKDLLKDFVESL